MPIQATRSIFKHQSVVLSKKKRHKQEKEEHEPIFCPICSKKLLILYVDPLFKQILLNSGFYKRVKIFNNGEYTFENIPKANREAIEIGH